MKGGGLVWTALIRALAQLGDARLLGVLVSVVAFVALFSAPFAVMFVGMAWVLELLVPASVKLPWLGEVGFLGVFTAGLTSRASWAFWTYVISPLSLAVVGMFLDSIVAAVERKHYPKLPLPRRRSLPDSIFYGVRFLVLSMSVSLLALVASYFSGVLAPAVFVLANGYLMAREYFETVALRRLPEPAVRRIESAYWLLLMPTGALLALSMTLPVVNLLVPIVGVAVFTHLFHSLPEAGSSGPTSPDPGR